MPPLLEKYLTWCQKRTPTLNSCLVNWYQDGEHYIGPHSDDQSQILKESEIYCISFGATRDFILEEKRTKGSPGGRIEKKKIVLENGTLVIMGGTTQQTHKHSIPKAKKVTQRRISITFRSFKELAS
jgi:alkylated DNA repair dioxygenase AlkB